RRQPQELRPARLRRWDDTVKGTLEAHLQDAAGDGRNGEIAHPPALALAEDDADEFVPKARPLARHERIRRAGPPELLPGRLERLSAAPEPRIDLLHHPLLDAVVVILGPIG